MPATPQAYRYARVGQFLHKPSGSISRTEYAATMARPDYIRWSRQGDVLAASVLGAAPFLAALGIGAGGAGLLATGSGSTVAVGAARGPGILKRTWGALTEKPRARTTAWGTRTRPQSIVGIVKKEAVKEAKGFIKRRIKARFKKPKAKRSTSRSRASYGQGEGPEERTRGEIRQSKRTARRGRRKAQRAASPAQVAARRRFAERYGRRSKA